ncbi:MAG: hypothetical protein IIC89_05385 [Chloroflexi bacterium]|nr:hypothetical protein [Chloroflexota bacterium]
MANRGRDHHRTHAGPRVVALAALSVLMLVFIGCGIGFGEEPEETELLIEVTIEEPVIAGQAVTVLLDYAQQYPVEVEVKCDLLSVNDLPTETPPATETVSPLALRRTPEPTLPNIPRVRPTPKNKVLEILGTTLQPNEDGGPTGTATPELGTIERRFLAPAPGDYVVWCYTPVDRNNAIFQELTVLPQ